MPRRNVADIAPDHLFLAQRLALMLPGAVIEVVMNHRTAAVVAQTRGRHGRTLQITPQIFHAVPGSPGLLRKMDFPVPAVLCLQIAPPLALIANMPHAREAAGPDAGVTAAQQADNGAAPDGLHGLLFEEEVSPDAVPDIEAAAGDGDMNVGMLIELAAIGVQGAENADLNSLLTGPLQHCPGGATEHVVEQGPVVVKKRPQQVWHGKSDVLPFAVGQNVLLLSNPLFGGLHAAGAACL